MKKIKLYYDAQSRVLNSPVPILFSSESDNKGEFPDDEKIKVLAGNNFENLSTIIVDDYDITQTLFCNNDNTLELIKLTPITANKQLFRLNNSPNAPSLLDYVVSKIQLNSENKYNEYGELISKKFVNDKNEVVFEVVTTYTDRSDTSLTISADVKFYRNDDTFATLLIVDKRKLSGVDYSEFKSHSRKTLYYILREDLINKFTDDVDDIKSIFDNGSNLISFFYTNKTLLKEFEHKKEIFTYIEQKLTI